MKTPSMATRTFHVCTVLLVAAVALAGCAAGTRPPQTQGQLLQLRDAMDQHLVTDGREMFQRLLVRVKGQYDAYSAGRATAPPVIDILIISGGGDWGAFGAGFLKGWSRVPPGPMAKPAFDAVTGVSTGALIAPFAFLGDAQSNETILGLYRNPQKDWVKQRGPLYFLPNNLSFAEVPGLEREMRAIVTPALVRRVAEAGGDGRILAVNTTNVDDGSQRVWNLVAEARRAVETNDVDRIHRIMLASAGIPGAFPFRLINDELYVDGGVTGNIIYGGRVKEEDSLPALWAAMYPSLPIPKIRYWVLFNNQLRPQPQVTAPTWPAVVTRSLEMGTRAATLTSIRHLHAQAEISRLKRGAEVEVRLVAVPNDWVAPQPGVFIKETMNNLADLGEKMGADPLSWRSEPPPP
jgi:hypothetical protein